MESSDRYESGHLAGFFVGALFGAGIALLFAPQAGAELRRLLRDAAGNAKDELKETIRDGTEVLESAVAQGQEFMEKGRESLRETGRQAQELGAGVRKAFNQTKDDLASQCR
jgi:gas vesicle protein